MMATSVKRPTSDALDYLNKVKREARLNVKGGEGEGEDKGGLANKKIDKMKCAELHAALKERGLRWTGVKADLVQQLKKTLSVVAPGQQLTWSVRDAKQYLAIMNNINRPLDVKCWAMNTM